MSDDLVEMARLAQHDERMATGALYGDLADRIEELEAQRNFAQRQVVAAETKLARAVDTLMFYGGVMPNAFLPIQDGGEKARTTLAELKGEGRG